VDKQLRLGGNLNDWGIQFPLKSARERIVKIGWFRPAEVMNLYLAFILRHSVHADRHANTQKRSSQNFKRLLTETVGEVQVRPLTVVDTDNNRIRSAIRIWVVQAWLDECTQV